MSMEDLVRLLLLLANVVVGSYAAVRAVTSQAPLSRPACMALSMYALASVWGQITLYGTTPTSRTAMSGLATIAGIAYVVRVERALRRSKTGKKEH